MNMYDVETLAPEVVQPPPPPADTYPGMILLEEELKAGWFRVQCVQHDRYKSTVS